MNRENWKPKVGDKVRITGHGSVCMSKSVLFTGTVHRVVEIAPDGFVGVFDNFAGRVFVHHRLCDPVLEDERRGAPRPPIQEGETVEILCRVPVRATGLIYIYNETLSIESPRVRQIERRNPGCKACLDRGCNKVEGNHQRTCTARGREARKS